MLAESLLVLMLSLSILLVIILYYFNKYKGRLDGVVLTSDGGCERIKGISGKSSFNVKDRSYNIRKAFVHMDHWVFPRKSIYYHEGYSEPVGYGTESSNDNENKDQAPPKKNVGPWTLNDILKTDFSGIMETESSLFNFSISRKWLLVLIVIVVLAVAFFFGLPEVLESNPSGSEVVAKPVN